MSQDSVHVVCFESWLELDVPDAGALAGTNLIDPRTFSQQIATNPGWSRLAISSFEIEAMVNAIPSATVMVPTGLDMTQSRPVLSHANNIMSSKDIFSRDYVHAKIMFRNVATNETTCVFDGFVLQIGTRYADAGLQIELSIVHWAWILNLCPLICTSITSESFGNYAAALLHGIIPASAQPDSMNKQFALTVDEVTTAAKDAFDAGRADVISSVFYQLLAGLHKINSRREVIFSEIGEFTASMGDLPDGYRIEDLINPMQQWRRICPGSSALDSMSARFKNIIFKSTLTTDAADLARVKIEDKTIPDRFIGLTVKALEGLNTVNGTAWFYLTKWANLFSLAIVPRVHELRFIPQVAVPLISASGATLSLRHCISIRGNSSTELLPAMTIVIPSSAQQVSKPSVAFTADAWAPQRGVYAPPETRGGQVSVELLPVPLDGFTDSPLPVHTDYAKYRFWHRRYAGRTAHILSPIRFDVCPGSMVDFSTDKSALSPMTGFGYVQAAKWGYTESQFATVALQVGYTRLSGTEKTDGLDDHFYYEGEPFTYASWTDSDFKTI